MQQIKAINTLISTSIENQHLIVSSTHEPQYIAKSSKVKEQLTSRKQKLMGMKIYALNLALMTLEIMQKLPRSKIP